MLPLALFRGDSLFWRWAGCCGKTSSSNRARPHINLCCSVQPPEEHDASASNHNILFGRSGAAMGYCSFSFAIKAGFLLIPSFVISPIRWFTKRIQSAAAVAPRLNIKPCCRPPVKKFVAISCSGTKRR